jgi:glycosyltransferase involved in cell wall biosynthesis
MPTASILINNYNNGPWLRDCVNSALAQTRPADEVIVYDDGSTDDSVAILRSYGGSIRLIEGVHDYTISGRENQKVAIHRAFLTSSGDHVYLLDGDDCYLPDHLAGYEALWRDAPDHVMVHGSMRAMDAAGTSLGSLYRADRISDDYRKSIYRDHDTDFFYPTSSLAFRRDFLSCQLPADFSYAASLAIDAQLSLAAVFAGTIGFVRADTVVFRVRRGSLSEQNGFRGTNRLHESLNRIRVFNTYAVRHGQPRISAWWNRTVWQQVARLLLPGWVSAPFLQWKLRRYRKMTTPQPAP